jgi:hypothetical protein
MTIDDPVLARAALEWLERNLTPEDMLDRLREQLRKRGEDPGA